MLYTMKTHTFKLGNLCCVICADDVQKALRADQNIVSASVDYLHDTARVTYRDNAIGVGEIAHLIEMAGHGCSKVMAGAGHRDGSVAELEHAEHTTPAHAATAALGGQKDQQEHIAMPQA